MPTTRNPDKPSPGGRGFLIPGEVHMATAVADIRAAELARALTMSRKARHHPDCYCRMYERAYCNPTDALWQRSINRILEQ